MKQKLRFPVQCLNFTKYKDFHIEKISPFTQNCKKNDLMKAMFIMFALHIPTDQRLLHERRI